MQLTLRPGDNFENIFERTIYYRNVARRISGFATYRVEAVRGTFYKLGGEYEYYGARSGKDDLGAYYERDGVYYLMRGKRFLGTDASGPFFSVWLWGEPPREPYAGETWIHHIPKPWELGPAGMQTVRVVSVDRANGRIVLERSGSGIGAPLGRPLPKIDGVQPYFGKVTWKGTATVRHGLIESDQLVMHADVVVPATAVKSKRIEKFVEQIELGQTPYTGSSP